MSGIATNRELGEQITRAIGAHGHWKARLRSAADAGLSELDPATVRRDDVCEFGVWLHRTLEPAERASSSYVLVRDLHARFHAEAAKVVDHVASGRRDAANAALEAGSPFSEVSGELTRAMMAWKSSVGA